MTLHIYGQRWWHDSATIVGDRAALEHLRTLIDMALESNTAAGEFFAQDGEGYHGRVFLAAADHEYWQLLAMPYTDEDAKGTSQGKVWPSDY
jgi:hypothetical protein